MANQYDTNLKLQAIADAIGDTQSSGLIQALEDIADAVAGGGGGGSSAAGLVSDNFSDTATYDLGDYCIHNNTLYVCINAINTPGPWDLTDWQATNSGIELSLLNSALELVDLSSKIHTNQNFNPYLLSMKKQGNIYIIDYSMYAASAFSAGQARQLFLIDDVTLAPGIHATGLHLNSSQAYKGIMRVYSTATDIRFESTAAGAVNDFFEGQIVFTV